MHAWFYECNKACDHLVKKERQYQRSFFYGFKISPGACYSRIQLSVTRFHATSSPAEKKRLTSLAAFSGLSEPCTKLRPISMPKSPRMVPGAAATGLVAPIVEAGKTSRPVYLPRGAWRHYFTGEAIPGEQTIRADAPLDTIPVFIKAQT